MMKAASSLATTLAVILVLMLQNCENAGAEKIIVGDDLGWSNLVSMESWAAGKQFFAGDVLVFDYEYYEANVIIVTKEGHDTCSITEPFTAFHTGHEEITLGYGVTYFICSINDQCPLGMKMAINATARPPATTLYS